MRMTLDFWNELPDWSKALLLLGVRLLIGSVNWPKLYRLTIRLSMRSGQLARRGLSWLKRAVEGDAGKYG